MPQGNRGQTGWVVDRWRQDVRESGHGDKSGPAAKGSGRLKERSGPGCSNGDGVTGPQGSLADQRTAAAKRSLMPPAAPAEHAAETRRRGWTERKAKRIEVRRPGVGSNAGPHFAFGGAAFFGPVAGGVADTPPHTRYPSIMLPPVLDQFPLAIGPWLDLVGLAVFAASGALAAAKRGQTIVTLSFFALVTGVGGGTVRDLLIGAPVFWVHDSRAAAVCLIVAFVIWITPERWWRGQALDWFDALGLAAYAVFGAAKALAYGIPPVPAALMGVVAACVGGIIRDVLAGEPSIIMRPEIYVTAAALAAALYVGLIAGGAPAPLAAIVAASAGFALRAAAISWKLALPAYRGRG